DGGLGLWSLTFGVGHHVEPVIAALAAAKRQAPQAQCAVDDKKDAPEQHEHRQRLQRPDDRIDAAQQHQQSAQCGRQRKTSFGLRRYSHFMPPCGPAAATHAREPKPFSEPRQLAACYSFSQAGAANCALPFCPGHGMRHFHPLARLSPCPCRCSRSSSPPSPSAPPNSSLPASCPTWPSGSVSPFPWPGSSFPAMPWASRWVVPC